MAELHQDEEAEATPNPESETKEEASELDNLLKSLDEEEAQGEKETVTGEPDLDEDEGVRDKFNDMFGTNYTSEEEMQKGIKELRQKASKPSATAKKTPVASATKEIPASPDLSDDILEMRFPESKAVMADLTAQSEATGKSKLEIYKSSTFMQNEAKARGQEESNTQKVNTPSQIKGETNYSNITEEELMKLPADKRNAVLREMASKGM